MPWPITAMSMCNALGADRQTVLASLRQGRSGLSPLGAADGLPFTSWFGRIDADLPLLPPSLAAHDSRQSRLTLLVCEQVAEAVRVAVRRWGAARVGVAIGTTTGGISDTERAWPSWAEIGSFPDGLSAPDWLRLRHNLHTTADVVAAWSGALGPTLVQSSACASSARVLGTALRWLRADLVDAVITGGIDTACRYTQLGFHGMGILSSGRTRPFAAGRDGINLGEAAALLLVERDGHPEALLHGVGETSDAWHLTQPRPDGEGLAAAMRQALGGVPAEYVDLLNAHATGTPANDAAEAVAIRAVLAHRPWVAATKPLTGHTLGAAGATEAAITLLSLRHGLVPATLTGEPDPALADVRLTPAPHHQDLRFALSTSAAFGGHNAAVLMERA